MSWDKQFGDDYTERNVKLPDERTYLFQGLLEDFNIGSYLELGCNRGHNLTAILNYDPLAQVCGVELNEKAIREAYLKMIVKGTSTQLPFINGQFDMVFTSGLLIHLSDDDVIKTIKEMYRVSNKYLMLIEYFGEPREIDYREGVLCKARPYRDILFDHIPCKEVKSGSMKSFNINLGDDFSQRCDYLIVEK